VGGRAGDGARRKKRENAREKSESPDELLNYFLFLLRNKLLPLVRAAKRPSLQPAKQTEPPIEASQATPKKANERRQKKESKKRGEELTADNDSDDCAASDACLAASEACSCSSAAFLATRSEMLNADPHIL